MSFIGGLTGKLYQLYTSLIDISIAPTNPIYAMCKHTILRVDQRRGEFELMDGSTWSVEENDRTNFNSWKMHDAIAVAATNDLNTYEIIKMDPEENVVASIKASLYMGPKLGSGIEVVNIENDIIEINNRAPLIQYPTPIRLKASEGSKEEMKKWNVTDIICLALQHSPNHSEYNKNELTLINCTLGTHIHVTAF